MSSWNDVYKEVLARRTSRGTPDLDGVRREKLQSLSKYTKRPLIVYAADFLNPGKMEAAGGEVSLDWSDKEGFIEVIQGIEGDAVDIMLHSPGGMAEAVESIVAIVRERFRHVRFVVPNIAKSAATMLALSGDTILMDETAELGPIDPQFTFRKGDGTVVVAPAQAIIDQFELAEARISKDPSLLAPWLPILQQYGPSLYKQAKNAIDLSKSFVEEWLAKFMFREEADAKAKAKGIASYLSDHNNFKSHAKRIGLQEMASIPALRPIKAQNPKDDPELYKRVRALYNAVSVTFGMSAAYKLFESSSERTLVRLVQTMILSQPPTKPAGSGGQQPQPSTPSG